jgi:DNA-3-methyladenine glycosylase
VTRTDDAWLAGPVLEVAPHLLGALVTTHSPDGVVTIRLTEVEAYDGGNDPGSHAYRGRSARNAVMFGPAGYLYVYRHLGLHVCANVVTGVEGSASAVLLRAGEVVEGADVARERRRRRGVVRSDVDLARGPARLADALGLGLAAYGADLLDDAGHIRLTPPPARAQGLATGPRVGVSGVGGDAVAHPWRFWIPGEPTVSAYRPAQGRRRTPPEDRRERPPDGGRPPPETGRG